MTSKIGQKALLAFFAVVMLVLTQPKPAAAQFTVSSPKVEKGELDVEYHSSFQSGLPSGAEDAISQGHEVTIGYGLTDFWKAEVTFGIQKPKGDSFEASTIDFDNTFQLGKYQPWNATFGLLAGLSVGLGDDEPNAFELGGLAEFGDDNRSLILNGIFEKTFGDNRVDGIGFQYAAQVKFAIGHGFSLGAEAFGEIADLCDTPSFNDTELRAGPVLFFDMGSGDDDAKGKGRGKGKDDDDEQKMLKRGDKAPQISAALGVLFGATDATPDTTVKWDLEISF
jgi:hypothetical protein